MFRIPEKITPALSRKDISSLNRDVRPALSRATICGLNDRKTEYTPSAVKTVPQVIVPAAPVRPAPAPQPKPAPVAPAKPAIPHNPLPAFRNPVQRGQKTPLWAMGSGSRKLKVCFGWNILDARCELDASAFLLGAAGKVPGDDWFVFYGQPTSPDGSVELSEDHSPQDRQCIRMDLDRLNPSITKIAFVMTINEAFSQNLSFSMVKDAYIRILDGTTSQELVSYPMPESLAGVTSMTIGELYLHSGQWKFNPIGNGVRQDLAGQCAIYGVEIS